MLSLKKWMDIIYTWAKAPISKPFEIGENRKLLILANGPSAKVFWEEDEVRSKFSAYDLMCMNHAIYEAKEKIYKYKPLFFILLDPVFFSSYQGKSSEENEFYTNARKKVYEVLKNVNWKAYLVTNYHGDIELHNNNITIIRLNRNTITPKKNRYYKLYKDNLANPGINTVLDGAIYFAVTYEYKEIALLGVEYNFFKKIVLDENNMIFSKDEHFYQTKYPRASGEAAISCVPEESQVAYYLRKLSKNFSMFFELDKYAKYYGCIVYNYTKDSMIDAFERKPISL